ncbi:alpha/beta hydrolase [Geomonas limicola]|uniref:Alpha/beta hydrolase n=1 Tax=Geomonas limicola TaxID=2740186 RepID=A0A6V8N7Z0_9BACT|nr:alpha/beta hydrolase [Geomonas limicola]GFO68621.1 alpha/beta hydrolase [Geomonas limicola]
MDNPLFTCNLSGKEILRYRVAGHGPRALVLLHGLASRSQCWTDLVPLFSPDSYTIYLVDLLGSGESAKPAEADYSIRGHAHRLLEFLERLGLRQASVVGHSLGGAVVLLATLLAKEQRRQHLLRKVVVLAGPGYLQGLPLIARVFRYPLVGPFFINLYAPTAWVKVGLKAAYYDQHLVDREHIERYAPCYQDRASRQALVATCRQLVPPDVASIPERYGEIDTPMLLLWGRHDLIVPLSQGERLAQAVPGARLVVLEACGHNPQEEKALETYLVIEQFLRMGTDKDVPKTVGAELAGAELFE